MQMLSDRASVQIEIIADWGEHYNAAVILGDAQSRAAVWTRHGVLRGVEVLCG